MHSSIKRLIVLLCAAAILLLPLGSTALAQTEYDADELTAERMAVDLVVVRPIGMVASVAGCLIYLTSLPFSIPGGNADQVWDTTVVKPAKFTFNRPLGDF